MVLGARPAQAPARTRLGKPYLPGTAGFGLSDSGGVQAALYANRKYVGIDIERLDRPDLAARRHRLGAWVARAPCAGGVPGGLGRARGLRQVRGAGLAACSAAHGDRLDAAGRRRGGAVDIGLDFAGRRFVAAAPGWTA